MSSTPMEDLNFEGSFSFAGSDFMNSSSFAFISDDEDDNDQYIEIALDHCHHHKSTLDDDEGDLRELDYLRISFSSTTVPFPEVSDLVNSAADETVTETPSSSSSSSSSVFTGESSSSTATTYKDRPLLGSESGRFHETRRKTSPHMPLVNRILETLLISVRAPSSVTGKRNGVEDDNEKQLTIHSDSGDQLRNRKASKMRAAMNGTGNGMMMKLLIKIRGIKLGTLFASFLKPRGGEVVVVHHEDHIINHSSTTTTGYDNKKKKKKKTSESGEYYRRLFMKPLDRWLIQRNRDNGATTPASSTISVRSDGGVGDHKYSKLMNINGAMRGVLRAMSFSKLEIINNAKSCPSSIKSSPLHHPKYNDGSPTTTKPADHHNYKLYTRDNSIQAAIAHCKTSFSI